MQLENNIFIIHSIPSDRLCQNKIFISSLVGNEKCETKDCSNEPPAKKKKVDSEIEG